MRSPLPRFLLRLFFAPALAAPVFAASPAWFTAHDAEIEAIVEQMTLAEKAGQMTQPNVGALQDPSHIARYHLGSVLSGGGTDPDSGNALQDWSELYEDYQARALSTRLGIPLLYGIDAVHGHNNVLGAVIFPHHIGLGCTQNPALVEEVSRITAKELRATGIQWTFAPCVAVPRDIRWGRTYEGFSEDPALVTLLGTAAVRGLQTDDLSSPEAALACAKHFIADGGTTFRGRGHRGLLDQGDAQFDEATLRAIHLPSFIAAIDAGVGSIMPSFSSWNGVKVSGSRALLTDLLKEELGFEGLVISDYNAIDQLVDPPVRPLSAEASDNAFGQIRSSDYKRCVELGINAGLDMVMVTDRYLEFIRYVQELVEEGKIPMARIDDAVTRVLRVKFALGMMEPGANLLSNPRLKAQFGSAVHREVGRRAVRESLVLLKNEARALPLSRAHRRIHVSGRGAEDLGLQCGGWTISWQGQLGDVTTGGTTVVEALRARAGPRTRITTDAANPDLDGADVAVVVIGEKPYAEGRGDVEELSFSAADHAAVANAAQSGIPVVVVMLTGRPIPLGPILEQADALVAAWLPGTEALGLADVLYGDFPPTGKLSFAWPRTMAQVPLGHGEAPGGEPLFPLSFGLTY